MSTAGERCIVCEAPVAPFALCFCCNTLVRQLRMALVPLVPLAAYRTGDLLHRRLRGYKDAPVAEARRTHSARLASLLERWAVERTADRRPRIDGWDVVTAVPSSFRPAAPAVEQLVLDVPVLASVYRRLLVRGPDVTGHLLASRRGFGVHPDVDPGWLRGRRVLLVEDSVVTGARAQSAAATLRVAGARVPAIVAIGRLERTRTARWSGRSGRFAGTKPGTPASA